MMIQLIVAVLAGLLPLIPAVIYFLRQRRGAPVQAARSLVLGLSGFNVVLGLLTLGFSLAWLASPPTALASGATAAGTTNDQYASLAAAIATGLSTIAAGIAVSSTGAAAIGAIAEKPASFGRSLIFVGMAEGIAIYGLLISFLVLNR
jgi:V/A-type H+/Na+-transporting ATPase subunit K